MEEESNVMPDISDPLANEPDVQHGATVTSVTAVPVASVSSASVSLPVSSLIGVSGGTTTFNVITPDQLQIQGGSGFKPHVLCVENSFLCDPRSDKETEQLRSWVRSQNGEIKATHIVIQSEGASLEEQTINTPSNSINSSWTESANMAVLPVRCKSTNAEFHKCRFGSGGRGRCIKFSDGWYTPSEFEALCGRASSKDWKRSIRFGGRSLQTLIDEGVITPHATSCTCSACCDDDSATGPIRLFTPYKRRRRKETIEDIINNKKYKFVSPKDGSNGEDSGGESINKCDETWTNSVGGGQYRLSETMVVTSPLVPTSDSPTQSVNELPDFNIATTSNHADDIYKRLEERMIKNIVYQFRRTVEELKDFHRKEIEEIKEAHQQSLMVARMEAQNACTREESIPVQVVDPLETVGLEPTSDAGESKKCANCNREAFAECSLCRRTPYCSTFCQRRDWNTHQMECINRTGNPGNSNSAAAAAGSIMLIVESAEQVVSSHQE